ncbi:hypothetical protein N7528_006719 [Penicillium herquei]|nr:hypothetical protein N7528_006719 [Penicillium herquei]
MSDLPDYVLDPNAVLKDTKATWRHGNPPDYSNTRAFYEKTKQKTHEHGSLQFLVENLVKNWEIEASFKTNLADWRTIDQDMYTFSLNGGEPRSGHHMLEVGTYNALLTASQYYDPTKNSFDDSHKSFKRMMPTFAWEVLEVYAGPPVVVARWRHWGEMKNDYVGYNGSGEKVTVKSHGGVIDIQGLIVAKVNEKLQVQSIDVWFDPMEMFRQIGQEGNGASSGSGCPFARQ